MASSAPRNLHLERLTEGQNYRELHFCQQNSVLGCNPASLEANRMNEDFLIYEVIDPIESVEENSTDEGQNDKTAENSTLPMDESHALRLSPPTSSAGSLSTTLEGLPMDSLDSANSRDDENLGLSEATKSLSWAEIDFDDGIPKTIIQWTDHAPGPSKRVLCRSSRLVKQNGKFVNPDSTSAEAAPGPSKTASQSRKKVRSPMNFAGDFKDGPKGGAGSSCNGSQKESRLQKSRKDQSLEKKLEKADPVELASIKSTTKQTAAGKSIQSPNVEKRALDPPTSGAREGKQKKPEKKMKRPAAICIGDEDKISPIKKVKLSKEPIIIDAPHLCKIVSSDKSGPSATSTPLASRKTSSQRRLSVDAPLVTPEGRGLKEKLATERKEKLRLLAERDKERRAAQEEKKRVDALKEKPKTVLVKVKNRGDFLSEIPEKPLIPPRRHSVSYSPKVHTTSSDPMSKKTKSNNLALHEAELDAYNHSEVTAGHRPPPAECTPIEAPEAPPVVNQTSGTSLTPILKRQSNTFKRSRHNVRFEEDESGNIVTHVREIENNQSDRLPLDPMEQLTEGVKKKLAREQYWSQQRIECQSSSTSTSRSPVPEALQPEQQNGLKVNFDNSHEYRSAPSLVSKTSKPSDVMISNEQQTINRILQWKTDWLQSANTQPEAGRGRGIERELLVTVVSKYQELYKNANDSWDILTVKEVARLNLELCELTFFSSASTLPRNYEIGSLLLLKTHESSSFGYISRIWRGAGEARFITVQTSLDYSKLDRFGKVKSRHVLEILSGVKSINARWVN